MRLYLVLPDKRGDSATYEAMSLVCWDALTGNMVWHEGIRKDRCSMFAEWRTWVEPELKRLKRYLHVT